MKLAEAPSFGRTIFEHAPDSNGARDYESFCNEFLVMIGMAEPAPAAVAPAAAMHPVAQEPPAAQEPPPAIGAAEG